MSRAQKRKFNAIWGNAPNDIWAVGDATSDGNINPRYYSTTVHFDGTGWKRIPVQAPGAGMTSPESLTAVHGTGANNVWVSGGGRLLHWNGTAWVDGGGTGGCDFIWVGGPNLSDVVTCSSVGAAWGTSSSDLFEYAGTVLQHSNGTTTTIVATDIDLDPGTRLYRTTSLWAGPKDVYIVYSSGVTIHLAR